MFSKDKIENILFYYYISFNFFLQTLEKSETELKIFKEFQSEKLNEEESLDKEIQSQGKFNKK